MTDELEDQMIARTQGYVDAQKAEEALASANELAEVDPKDAIVWYLKGKAHFIAGEYDEALSALSRAASLQAEQPGIWLVMGYTLIALRRYAEARPSLEYVRGAEPENAQAAAALGLLHVILGDAEAARPQMQDAFSLNAPTALSLMAHFNEEFLQPSPALSPATKKAVENLLDSLKGQD